MNNQNTLKKATADAAMEYILPSLESNTVIGVGTGSTANYFIDVLVEYRNDFDGCVASSEASTERLRAHGIPVYDLNSVGTIPFYIDGADEVNSYLQLVKGGGGALTREKIVAAAAKEFVCIADESKKVATLGAFPLPVEVIPMARSYVGRELVKLGGDPSYREGVITDNGNVILDVWNLTITDPVSLEKAINDITGVVTNGLFALKPADILFLAEATGIRKVVSK